MPVRKIPKNYRNVTGRQASKKAKGQAEYESTLERDFLTLLEFLPDIISYEVQPILINWVDQNRKARTYTPDVQVNYQNGSSVIFEVKYCEELQENWQQLKPKFRSAIKYCRQHQIRFKLITEKQIRTPLLENAKFLLPYQQLRLQPTEWIQQQKVMSLLNLQSATTITELLAPVSLAERATLLPVLWQMIATGSILVDLNEVLTMQSLVWKN